MREKTVSRTLLPYGVPIILAAVVLFALCPVRARCAEPEPAILARVNGEPVTRDEMRFLLAEPTATWRLQQEGGDPAPEPEALQRRALEELIHRHLLLQEARRRHLTVGEEELDQALAGLRRRFDSIESFGAWMHERGLNDKSLFDALRDGLLINRVMAVLVEGIRVTDEEVRQYYEANQDGLVIGEEVRLRIIAVRDEAAAEQILTALRKGEDFSRLAQQRSIGQRAAQGGDTGWVDVRTLPPLLREAVGMLKAGDVGGPLRKTADEFLLVGLVGRRPLRAASLAAARPAIEQRLLATKQQEAIQEWLSEQKLRSTIEVLHTP